MPRQTLNQSLQQLTAGRRDDQLTTRLRNSTAQRSTWGSIWFPTCCHSVSCSAASQMQSATQSFSAAHMTL
jgi:hypothetical protein